MEMTDAWSAGSSSRLFPPPPMASSNDMLQMLQPLQQPVFRQLSQVGNAPPPPPVSSDKEPMLLRSAKSELSLSTLILADSRAQGGGARMGGGAGAQEKWEKWDLLLPVSSRFAQTV